MEVNKLLPGSSALGLAIVFAGSMGIGYVAVYLINRFMPWLLDIRKIKK